MIRVPDDPRLELRLADGAANPYILQAAMLAAGLEGMAAERDPGARLDINMYTEADKAPGVAKLPLNLLDALRALEGSAVLGPALGGFVPAYLKLKHQEWNGFAGHLTDWERAMTLDC